MCHNEWDIATIIFNTAFGVYERQEKLNALAKQTKDLELKKQIEERISYETKSVLCFDDNTSGKYVYVVMVSDYETKGAYPAGYFKNSAMAEAYGTSKKVKFVIEKHEIIDKEIPKQPSDIHLNPYLFSKETIEIQEAEKEYDGSAIGAKHFDEEGTLQYVYTHETKEEEAIVDSFLRERFENRFVEVDYSFARGDFVRIKDTDDIGIVQTSKEEYDQVVARYKEGIYLDWFDSAITVQFLNSNGEWGHEHIHPILLEPVALKDIEKDCQELYKTASLLISGKGSLDYFLLIYDDFKKKRGMVKEK